MQQQGEVVLRRAGEIPFLKVEEVIVLRMHLQAFVIGQIHAVGGLVPAKRLVAGKPGAANQILESLGPRAFEIADRARGVTQILARHQVGEIVVVDERGVLVGPGDTVDQNRPSLRSEKKPRSHHSRAVSTRISAPYRLRNRRPR